MNLPSLDIVQTIAFVAAVVGLWSQLRSAQRQRDSDREARLKEHLRLEAKVTHLEQTIKRHSNRDDKIFDRLESISERLARIEGRKSSGTTMD